MRWKHLLAGLIIGIVLFVAWGRVLETPFQTDDYFHLMALGKEDGPAILNTYSSERFSDEEMHALLPWWLQHSDFKFRYFRPLASYTFWVDRALWGEDPRGFHLTNLLLHILSALLLYALAISLGLGRRAAILAALLAGLHPDNLLALAWVASRDVVLAMPLFLLCCLCFVGYLRGGPRRRICWAASLGFMFLGLLAKETLFFAPVVLQGIALWTVDDGGSEGIRAIRRGIPRSLVPFFLLSLAYLVWYFGTGHGVRNGYVAVSSSLPWVANLAVMGRNLLCYVVSLPFYLPPDAALAGPSAPVMLGGAAVLAAVVAAYLLRRDTWWRNPLLPVSCLWMAVFMCMPLCFLPMGRLLYFSVFGYALFAATVLSLFHGWLRRRWARGLLRVAVVVCFVLLPLTAVFLFSDFVRQGAVSIGPDLEAQISALVQRNPEIEEVYLLNVPNSFAALYVKLVWRYYNPDTPRGVFLLANGETVPEMEALDARTLRLSRPEGVIRTGQAAFQTRHLREGASERVDGFRAETTHLEEGRVTTITYTFDRPLADPRNGFARLEEGVLERVRFEPGEVPSAASSFSEDG